MYAHLHVSCVCACEHSVFLSTFDVFFFFSVSHELLDKAQQALGFPIDELKDGGTSGWRSAVVQI